MSGTRKAKRVVVNADDLGFSEGVTEGILRAHREGIVTSSTLAANMPAAASAVRRLAEVPDLGVGVHLNVSQGPPLSAAGRLLADADGVMRSSAMSVVLACARSRAYLAAVAAECDAQIRWVLDHGVRPTHLDSHRHVHAWPGVFARVARLARRYHIRFVRWHREVLPGDDWPAAPASQERIRTWTNLFGAWNVLALDGVRHASGTWGIAHTGLIDAAWLVRAARAVRGGLVEIMTHPGLADDLNASVTRLRESRQAELRALCEPAVKGAFRRNGIERVHYGEL